MATIEKNEALEITNEIKAAINDIFKKHGMDAPQCKTTYGDFYRITIQASPLEAGPGGINLKSQEAQYYTRFGYSVYRGAGDTVTLTAPLGTEFRSDKGEPYLFAGIAAKRRKFPIVAVHAVTGETILFTDHAIARINAAAAK